MGAKVHKLVSRVFPVQVPPFCAENLDPQPLIPTLGILFPAGRLYFVVARDIILLKGEDKLASGSQNCRSVQTAVNHLLSGSDQKSATGAYHKHDRPTCIVSPIHCCLALTSIAQLT